MANASNIAAAQLQGPSPAAPMSQTSPVSVPSAAYQTQMQQAYQSSPRRLSNLAPQTPLGSYQASPAAHPYTAAQPSPYGGHPTNRLPGAAPVYNPNAPRPVEVFHLVENANLAIPEDIRRQFHCDERGHVLFFSAPPLDIIPATQPNLGHSLKYLAVKDERQRKVAERKRKLAEDQKQRDEEAKRQRADEESRLAARVEALAPKAVASMLQHIASGTNELYQALSPDHPDSARAAAEKVCGTRVEADRLAHQQTLQIQAQSRKEGDVSLKRSAMYLGEI